MSLVFQNVDEGHKKILAPFPERILAAFPVYVDKGHKRILAPFPKGIIAPLLNTSGIYISMLSADGLLAEMVTVITVCADPASSVASNTLLSPVKTSTAEPSSMVS